MLRSRVTSGIDMVRLGNAISRPGIDPRIWVSTAVLTSDVYVDTEDGAQGVFADVQLLPSQMQDTARVGAIYAGAGFGLYTPLHEGDEVLVCAPSGDPDEGLVIVQRLWSTSDPQPEEIVQDADDVILVVEPEKSLRITTKGTGNVVLAVDSGKIYLGSPDSTEPVAKGDTLKSYLESIKSVFDNHVHVSSAPGTPSGPPVAPPPVPPPDPPVPPSPTGFPSVPDAILATTTEVL